MKFQDKIHKLISRFESYILSQIEHNFGLFDEQPFPSRYFEPALIIAGITTIIYLINYYYLEAYFAKISFPHGTFNLPISFYLPLMLGIFYINLFLLAITFGLSKKSPETLLQLSISNIILLAMIVVLIFRAITHSVRPSVIGTNIEWMSPAIQCIFFLGIFLYFLKRKITFAHIIYERNFMFGILILSATLLVFNLSFASILGDFGIERLVHGDIGSYEIELVINDTNIDKDLNISGKTLILVMQREGNYYVVEKLNENELAMNQSLYIISNNQVNGAIIKRKSSSSWGLRQYFDNSLSVISL